MTEQWKHINENIPFRRCSLFFNSQRRYFAEGAYRDESFKRILSSTFFFLYHYKTGTPRKKLLFFYGWLKNKGNAGQMMDKISGQALSAEYTIWDDEEILRVTGKNVFFPFTRRFYDFVKCSARFFFAYLKYHRSLQLNTAQFLTYFLHKSARAAYLSDAVRKCRVQAFITYNDYLNIAADIAFALRSCKKNVYHIQHGVLSETNYPGMATHFLLWGEASRQKALLLGYRPDMLQLTGAACFETHTQKTSEDKTFIFFSQSNLPQATGEPYCSMARQWIKEAALRLKDWKFIIRLHPDEESNSYYQELLNIPNIEVHRTADALFQEAAGRASVCATIWSGAGLEAMILQRVLLIFTPAGFVQKTDWVKNGCIEITTSAELVKFLQVFSAAKISEILERQNIVLKQEILNPNAAAEIAAFILKQEQKENSFCPQLMPTDSFHK